MYKLFQRKAQVSPIRKNPQKKTLQEIDRLMRESTQNATFDIVRMVQAVTWKLGKDAN